VRNVRRVFLAALTLGVLATGLGAFASTAPLTWQDFVGRVKFPLYQPTVTFGFKPTLDGPFPCGYGGIETVGARYRKGSGKQAPEIGLSESYPAICGNDGESVTVDQVDINGVSYPLRVYCYSPGPRCTVKDGFKNGFALHLRQPASPRTWIQTSSRYVALDDFLKVVRSLTKVAATPGTAGTRTARGAFRSPSGNLSCVMGDSVIYCQSLKPLHTVFMGEGERPQVCDRAGCPLDRSTNAFPILAYGKQTTAGAFRCRSDETGVRCVAVASGKGFLINRDGVTVR
jgi:hypothetical protein